MASSPVRYLRQASLLSLTLLLGSAITAPVLGQFQTTDPYKPYNIYYKPFTYPIQQGVSASLPNQARLYQFEPGGRNYTSMDGYNLFGRGVGRLEGYAEGVRDRSYQANPDDDFYEQQRAREDKYFEAMATKDRRKRAALLREYNEMTQKAARRASPGAVRRNARAQAAKGENAAEAKPPTPDAEATADKPAKPLETQEPPHSILRRPSDLIVPRGGSSRGGLLRDPASAKPRAASPSEILERSLESEKQAPDGT